MSSRDLQPHKQKVAAYSSQVPYDWDSRKKYLDLPFPVSEYERRLRELRSKMREAGIDSLLVFGNSAEYGDLVYFANFIPFGRAAIVISVEENIEMFMTSAVKPKLKLNIVTSTGFCVQNIDNPEASGGVPAR